ncbi:MAG: hypothetical protein DRH26_19245 [Deltaproteobacteria bacterium]|nr:MAG: hypothetical protein DRH26_19245 [Deltaproteobacteria bacterium]
MEFNLKNLNPAARFFFDDGNKKEWVEIRVCPADVLEDINNKTSKEKVEYKKGNRFVTQQKDSKKWRLLFWDYVIADWGGVTSDGQKLECNAENKATLMGGSIQFSTFVSDKLEVLTDDNLKHTEAAEKN